MNFFLHALQWIVSLISFGGLCYLVYFCARSLVSMLRNERGARYALALFLAGYLLAATVQRLRFGIWDWPDVEYQIDATVTGR